MQKTKLELFTEEHDVEITIVIIDGKTCLLIGYNDSMYRYSYKGNNMNELISKSIDYFFGRELK